MRLGRQQLNEYLKFIGYGSQASLAKTLDVSPQYISALIKDDGNPSLKFIANLEKATNGYVKASDWTKTCQ